MIGVPLPFSEGEPGSLTKQNTDLQLKNGEVVSGKWTCWKFQWILVLFCLKMQNSKRTHTHTLYILGGEKTHVSGEDTENDNFPI